MCSKHETITPACPADPRTRCCVLLPLQPLLRIFFGSQTGTAEIYAKQLRSEAAKHGFRGESVDMGNWKKGAKEALLGAEICVFLMATYGEGDPTDTSKDFIDWLKDGDGSIAGLPEGGANLFSKMSFTVFGLGNRQYEKFNAVGKVRRARSGCSGAVTLTAGRQPPLQARFSIVFLPSLPCHTPPSLPRCSSQTRAWQRWAAPASPRWA